MKGIKTISISYSNKPPEKVFHTCYYEFYRKLNLIEFMIKTTDPLYHQYFESWENKINKKIVSLDPNNKKVFDTIVRYEQRIPTRNIKIKLSNVVKEIVAARDDLSFFHGAVFPLLNRMCLIHLVIEFEEFVKDSLRLVFQKSPSSLKSAKMIAIENIIDSKDYSTIKNLAIEKTIYDIIDGGIDEVIVYLKNFGLDLTSYKNVDKFKECFYRRNIIVHNNGIVNEYYLKKTRRDLKKNELDTSLTYLKNALNLLNMFAHHITDHLEKKFPPRKNFSLKSLHSK